MDVVRNPAVAGRFYPADKPGLDRMLARIVPVRPRRRAVAVVVPHAGYVYSGAIAGDTYASSVIPDRVVVLCPNHTGRGARAALFAAGRWQMPGGALPVDAELAARLLSETSLEVDTSAHEYEHAVEVQLPFLQHANQNVRITPICLSALPLDECVTLGEAMARVIGSLDEAILIVVSTDMSHYLAAHDAERLDRLALAPLLSLDAEQLYRTVRARDISMCGYVPATVGAVACRALGARSAELIRYGHSGHVSGDFDRVVGYAGLLVA